MEAGGGESWEEQKLLSHIHLGSNPYWLSAHQKCIQMSIERMLTAVLVIMTLTWRQPKYHINGRADPASVHSHSTVLYSKESDQSS